MSDCLAVESHLDSVGNDDLDPSLGTGLTSLDGHQGRAFNTAAALLLTLAALAGCASGPAPTALSSFRVVAAPDANYASATQVDLVFVSDARADAALPKTADAWFATRHALRADHPTMLVVTLQVPAGYPGADVALPPGYRKAIGVYSYANYLAPRAVGRCTLTTRVRAALRLEYDHIDCSDGVAAAAPAGHGAGDLFSQHPRALEQQLSSHRDSQAKRQWRSDYAILADAFNMRLAGKFPFAALGADDLPRAALGQFFSEQGELLAMLRSGAEKAPGAEDLPCTPDQCAFVREFDDTRKALAPLLYERAVLRLAVKFNTRPSEAAGADQVMRWTLSSGAAAIGVPNRQGVLDYRSGDALSLDLAWADRSPWRPASERQQPDLNVSGVSAQFSDSGEWGLLRMIERHRVPDSADAQPMTLGFKVPLAPQGAAAATPATARARLFVSLTLSTVDGKTRIESKVQLPPAFPHFAPR